MIPLWIALLLAAAAALVAWLWPFRGSRVSNPKRHHAADKEYTVVYIDGSPCAFTDEQILVAHERARKLKLE